MKYTEEISLEQIKSLDSLALKSITFSCNKNDIKQEYNKTLNDYFYLLGEIYSNGDKIYIIRPDYAHFIKGKQPLPEGFGYATMPFGEGRYKDLKYYNDNYPNGKLFINDNIRYNNKWWEFLFKLEDLEIAESKEIIIDYKALYQEQKYKTERYERENEHLREMSSMNSLKAVKHDSHVKEIETLKDENDFLKSELNIILQQRNKLFQITDKMENIIDDWRSYSQIK